MRYVVLTDAGPEHAEAWERSSEVRPWGSSPGEADAQAAAEAAAAAAKA